MDISFYLKPVQNIDLADSSMPSSRQMGEWIARHTEKHFPDLDQVDIAIVGVEEDRNALHNKGCAKGPDAIREYFYRLYPGDFDLKVADLGNIQAGDTLEDTFFALTEVMAVLLKKKIVTVVLGGGQHLSYAMYKAYEKLGQIINITAVDNQFDLGDNTTQISSRSYVSHIIVNKPNYLFNYTNLGFQTYLVNPESIDLMRKLFFDTCRAGLAQSNIPETEPLIRNADMVTFDVSAIRQSEAPGNGNATPNGFYGDEACQIAHYAGMNDRLTSFGIFELNPDLDVRGQTAHLGAQMLWCFINGFYNRPNEFPQPDSEAFIRYVVQVAEDEDGIVFYKSKKSARWWMEVKCTEAVKEKYHQHYIIPCSYNDYQKASTNELPDRWWQAFQKLM